MIPFESGKKKSNSIHAEIIELFSWLEKSLQMMLEKNAKHEKTYKVNEHGYIKSSMLCSMRISHDTTRVPQQLYRNAVGKRTTAYKWKISIFCVFFVYRNRLGSCLTCGKSNVLLGIGYLSCTNLKCSDFSTKFKYFKEYGRTLMDSRFCAWINPFALAQPYIHVNDQARKIGNKNIGKTKTIK